MAKLALLLVLANMTGLLSPSGVGTYTSSSSSAAAAEPVGASGVLDSRDPFRAVGVDTFALSAISLHIHTRTHTRVKSKNQVREVRRFVCGGHCGAATQQRRKHGGQNEGMHRKPLNIAKISVSLSERTQNNGTHATNVSTRLNTFCLKSPILKLDRGSIYQARLRIMHCTRALFTGAVVAAGSARSAVPQTVVKAALCSASAVTPVWAVRPLPVSATSPVFACELLCVL